MTLFVIEKFDNGRWYLSGWQEAESIEHVLRSENQIHFHPAVIPQPFRVRAATNVEIAHAREHNEFMAEQYGPPLIVGETLSIGFRGGRYDIKRTE